MKWGNVMEKKKKGGRPKKITDKRFREAAQKAHGNKKRMADMLGCDYSTLYRFVKNNLYARELLDEENEKILDMAEDVIIDAIKAGNAKVAMWYLCRKGKSRGYGNTPPIENEHVEIDVHTREMIERIKADSMSIPVIPEHIQPIAPIYNY